MVLAGWWGELRSKRGEGGAFGQSSLRKMLVFNNIDIKIGRIVMVLQKYPREYCNFEKTFAKKRFFQICLTFVCFKFLYFEAILGGTFGVIMAMGVGRGGLLGQFRGGTFGSNLSFFMFFFAFLKPKQNKKNFSLVMCSFFDFSHEKVKKTTNHT